MRRLSIVLACVLAAIATGAESASGYGQPGQLVLSQDGRNAYVSGSDWGTTVAMRRDPSTGALSQLATYDNGGGEAMALSPDGRFVYVAGNGYSQPGISAYARDPNAGTLAYAGTWTQAGARTHYLVISPDGRELYASDANGVVTLARDETTGALTHRGDVAQGVGGSVGGAITLSQDGRFLYAAATGSGPFGSGIGTLTRDENGNLTPTAYTDTGGCYCLPTSLHVSPDGHRLFAAYNSGLSYGEGATGAGGLLSTPDGSGLYVPDWLNHRLDQRAVPPDGPPAWAAPEALTRDPQTGALQPATGAMPIVKTYHEGQDGVHGVRQPSTLAISPDNRFVYLTGGGLGTVAIFLRDPATNRLTFDSLYPLFPDLQGQYRAAVTINGGAEYTNDRHVTLTIQRIPVAWPEVSNDGGFAPSQVLTPPAQSDGWIDRYPWTLTTTGPDKLPKTVYVRLVDGGPLHQAYVFAVASDDIVLDESKPEILSARFTSPARRARALSASRARRIAVRAWDGISGVSALQVARSRRHPGSWRAYSRRRTYAASGKRVFVRVRDRAGNRSKWRGVGG